MIDALRIARRGGAILDSNLLLLLFVGLVHRDAIAQCKHTRNHFDEVDYDVLLSITTRLPRILTTPHILTETNAFANQMSEPLRMSFRNLVAAHVKLLDERAIPAAELVTDDAFAKFGLTDTAIVSLTQRSLPLLSTDAALCYFVRAKGGLAVNFNHLRELPS